MTDESNAAAPPKPRGRPKGVPNRIPAKLGWGPGGNKQGERSITIAVTVKPELRELLLVAARDQYRALAAQAAKYIVDGLIRDGYIKPSKTMETP